MNDKSGMVGTLLIFFLSSGTGEGMDLSISRAECVYVYSSPGQMSAAWVLAPHVSDLGTYTHTSPDSL